MPSKTGPEELGAYVRSLRQARKISMRRAADLGGMLESVWRYTETGRLKGDRRVFFAPTPNTVEGIAKALDVDAEELYRIAGDSLAYRAPSPRSEVRTVDVSGLSDADVALVEELVDQLRGKAEE